MKRIQKLPTSLGESPIIDAIIEVRFATKAFKSVVFGLIYNEIKALYPGEITSLPIMQLPEQIREENPDFKFSANYRIENENFVIQVGYDVLSIGCKMPYIGWEEFFNHSLGIIKKIIDKGIIEKVLRVGVRYVNFFECDILDKCTISINLNENISSNTLLRSEIVKNGFMNILQISNGASFKDNNSLVEKKGSIIDLDTSKNYTDNTFIEHINSELLLAHECEKELFFSLLKKDFIDTLKPSYNE